MKTKESYDVYCSKCGAKAHVSYIVEKYEDEQRANEKLKNKVCPKCGGRGFGRYKPIL